jgi:hypothetical protein
LGKLFFHIFPPILPNFLKGKNILTNLHFIGQVKARSKTQPLSWPLMGISFRGPEVGYRHSHWVAA